jgi:hypothetical protein
MTTIVIDFKKSKIYSDSRATDRVSGKYTTTPKIFDTGRFVISGTGNLAALIECFHHLKKHQKLPDRLENNLTLFVFDRDTNSKKLYNYENKYSFKILRFLDCRIKKYSKVNIHYRHKNWMAIGSGVSYIFRRSFVCDDLLNNMGSVHLEDKYTDSNIVIKDISGRLMHEDIF